MRLVCPSMRRMAFVVLAAASLGLVLPSLATAHDVYLPASKLTLRSALNVDLTRDFATLRLHKATVAGRTVWYVITDVSDKRLADKLGLNFAPRLSNLIGRCPGCLNTVKSSQVLGASVIRRSGAPNFAPRRVLIPGPQAFPPLVAQPGAVAGPRYTPYLRIAGTDIVYNAPIVAVGNGPFDVTHHTNTHDRVLGINTDKRTVRLLFVRGFANHKHVLYLSFEASDAATAVIERSTFAPGLALSPFAGGGDLPTSARASIFTFINGQLGPTSPPAQGLRHVIIDGLNAQEATLQNTQLLQALRIGGDAHNVLDVFPTLSNPTLRNLYSPLWDLDVGVWSTSAVRHNINTAQMDGTRIGHLAARGLVTSPGGLPLGSANIVINCPALAFTGTAPTID